MPYVQSSGARIHYRVEGSGPPIVMVHGFSDSLVDWHEAGYVDALRDDYRLVLIDCRGHGMSDKPHAQEAYTMEMGRGYRDDTLKLPYISLRKRSRV